MKLPGLKSPPGMKINPDGSDGPIDDKKEPDMFKVSFPNLETVAYAVRPYFVNGWHKNLKVAVVKAGGQLDTQDATRSLLTVSFRTPEAAKRFGQLLIKEFNLNPRSIEGSQPKIASEPRSDAAGSGSWTVYTEIGSLEAGDKTIFTRRFKTKQEAMEAAKQKSAETDGFVTVLDGHMEIASFLRGQRHGGGTPTLGARTAARGPSGQSGAPTLTAEEVEKCLELANEAKQNLDSAIEQMSTMSAGGKKLGLSEVRNVRSAMEEIEALMLHHGSELDKRGGLKTAARKTAARVDLSRFVRLASGQFVFAEAEDEDNDFGGDSDFKAESDPDTGEDKPAPGVPATGDEVLIISLDDAMMGTLSDLEGDMATVTIGEGDEAEPVDIEKDAVRKVATRFVSLSELPEHLIERGIAVRFGKVATTLHRVIDAKHVEIKTSAGPRRVPTERVQAAIKVARLPRKGDHAELIGMFREGPDSAAGTGLNY